MFPSSGLFAAIKCPFSKRGICERPHCLYKHASELREMFGASCKSAIVDSAGVQNGCANTASGTAVNDGVQELERLDKEIESVRHEVEQEKRRLSHYQTVQTDSGNTNFSVKSEFAGNIEDGSPSEVSVSKNNSKTKTHSNVRKYVLDNSKPRTDLEYDPLSNFTADLRSYSSSVNHQKVKNVLKTARNIAACEQKKPLEYQPQLSRLTSPLEDSTEDGVLIIDLPPSPDKKIRRVQTPVDSVAGKSRQDKEEELKVIIKPHSLDSQTLCLTNTVARKVTSPSASLVEERVHINCGAEKNQGQSNFNENRECQCKPVDGSVGDSSACLENGEDLKIAHLQAAELLQKRPVPASPSATTECQYQNENNLVVEKKENGFQVELPHSQLHQSVENMNPLHPHHFPQSNSIFYKAPAAKADSLCRQQIKQAQTGEQPAQNNQWFSTKCVPSALPQGPKTSSKMPAKQMTKAAVNCAPPESYLQPAEPAPGSSQGPVWHHLSASCLTNGAESPSTSIDQPLNADEEVIIIHSCSEGEDGLNYSDMELSDSDPMEECYRIFMEAKDEDNGIKELPNVPVGAMEHSEKPVFYVKPKALQGRKRVAHEAKHAEQPVAKIQPQPQVLVPLRGPAVSGFTSQPAKIQQVQQKASMLTASVKAGQAFVSSSCHRKPHNRSAQASPPTPENQQPAPVENAYTNYISLGTAVIGVGNNLHLILPEGAFPLPVSSTSSQVTSVLTPISPMHTSAVFVKQSYHQPAVPTWQRYRPTAPVLIPAQARKPSLTSAFASAHSNLATSTVPPVAVKPTPTKRKSKLQSETAKDKVPHDVRQRYVNMFTEEFLKTTANVNDAFEKALAEEKSVYNRSVNKLKYLSVAVNALKRLKNRSSAAAKDENKVNSQKFKGNIPLNLKMLKENDDTELYESLSDYVLTEERLIESNYPVQHPEKPGSAVLFTDNKKVNADPLKRICCRCGATYSVSQTGKHIRKEECNYHYGKGVKKKVPGGVETRYSCCEGVMGAPGCQVFKLHVHDSLSLEGFVTTVCRDLSDSSCPGVFSLNCEMCYTIDGLELCRVTVVNSSLQVVYDTFVRPDSEVIDYNTRFSGISEEDLKGNHTSLSEVKEALLSFISADTILIGYGLETDLCALKLLHGMVVDTSVVFPHRLGPPHKLTLNNLTAEYLRRIIQESVCGHDTAEDAAACMELMLWKVKEDGKMKK